jgi:hypothetical protein
MKFNLLALACALLLAFGLSMGSFAGSISDADGDGVPDTYDNCINTDNGPLQGTCSLQQDADADGFGNACDADFDQSGTVGTPDLIAVLNAQNSATALYDIDCSGTVGTPDLIYTLNNQNGSPGPSGLGCADATDTGGNCPPL